MVAFAEAAEAAVVAAAAALDAGTTDTTALITATATDRDRLADREWATFCSVVFRQS